MSAVIPARRRGPASWSAVSSFDTRESDRLWGAGGPVSKCQRLSLRPQWGCRAIIPAVVICAISAERHCMLYSSSDSSHSLTLSFAIHSQEDRSTFFFILSPSTDQLLHCHSATVSVFFVCLSWPFLRFSALRQPSSTHLAHPFSSFSRKTLLCDVGKWANTEQDT